MGPSTRALLAEVGIAAGSACLDLGCGGGDVTFELARAAGPSGRVIGVDRDEIALGMARREAAERRIPNVAFEVLDVVGWEPDEQFDVVYARFLLSHLSDPRALIGAVHRHTRPDGVVIVEDIDFRGHFAEPGCPALQQFVELYTRSVEARGADPNIGPRLPGLLRTAGLGNVQMRLVHPAALAGGIKLLTCVTLEDIAQAVLQDGLTTESRLRETIDELYAFARDPWTVLGGPRVFQVWGRCGASGTEMPGRAHPV
jgi:SAM-dependent methyltransferase